MLCFMLVLDIFRLFIGRMRFSWMVCLGCTHLVIWYVTRELRRPCCVRREIVRVLVRNQAAIWITHQILSPWGQTLYAATSKSVIVFTISLRLVSYMGMDDFSGALVFQLVPFVSRQSPKNPLPISNLSQWPVYISCRMLLDSHNECCESSVAKHEMDMAAEDFGTGIFWPHAMA